MTEKAAEEKTGRRRIWRRLGQVGLGLVLGLVLIEGLFWWRDSGAFPHFNGYVADGALGVRLEPGFEQRFQFQNNPISKIRINKDGYRGGDFPAPSADEILVVGDSQVFGLGVEENQTFSAQLAQLTGRTVINAGVPTYGPLEYNQVVRELAAKRKPKTIIYTVNFVNDLFEWDRPNAARHAVWDGWAVRRETAPKQPAWFPMRHWLMSRSHAVYALRRFWQQHEKQVAATGVASEGTWKDLVALGEKTGADHVALNAGQGEKTRQQMERTKQFQAMEKEIENLSFSVINQAPEAQTDALVAQLRASSADIVLETGSEEGRYITVTARTLHTAATLRDRVHRKAAMLPGTDAKELKQKLDQRDALLQDIAAEAGDSPPGYVPSVLLPRLNEVAEIAKQNGAELVIVALPIDVQVSADEWKKYKVANPPDMAPTRIFISDLIETASRMGVRSIDATEALRAAARPAFLDGDIHMTANGHRALAQALVATLTSPLPPKYPLAGLPAGRTRVPAPEIWRVTPEATVAGSSDARCSTIRIAEWLRVTCYPDWSEYEAMNDIAKSYHLFPTGIDLVTVSPEARTDTLLTITDRAVTVVTPLKKGEDFVADFYWNKHKQRLTSSWPATAAKPVIAFGPKQKPGRAFVDDKRMARMCECWDTVINDERSTYVYRCHEAYGQISDACYTNFKDSCPDLLACARGDALHLPTCPVGFANGGATGQCLKICDDKNPCASGKSCVPWQGSGVCE